MGKTVLILICRKPIFWLISGTTQSVTNFKPIKNWPKSNAKNAFMYTSKNAPKSYCNSILFAFLFSSNTVGHTKNRIFWVHIHSESSRYGLNLVFKASFNFLRQDFAPQYFMIFPIHHYYFPPTIFSCVYI